MACSQCLLPDALEWHPQNGATMLRFSQEAVQSLGGYEPGQFFFVNIPYISLSEWHPFTASAVLEDGLVFYIKSTAPTMPAAVDPSAGADMMPRKKVSAWASWTSKLAEIAVQSRFLPLIRINGPFGHRDFSNFETLILIAGGIGITPMIATFAHLRRQVLAGRSIGRLRSVVLVWMSKSISEFRLFRDIFSLVASDLKGSAVSHIVEHFETVVEMTDEDILAETSTDDPALPGAVDVVPPGPSSRLRIDSVTSDSSVDSTAVDSSVKAGPSTLPACPSGPGASVPSLAIPNARTSTSSRGRRMSSVPCTFAVNLHCTRRESYVSLTTPGSADYMDLFVASGRCNVTELLEQHARGRRAVVSVCGPQSLAADVSHEAWKVGCDFHSEQFIF